MSDSRPLSPSRHAFQTLKQVFALFFLAAITVPYASLYRLEHGTYFTKEALRLFPVSFGVCALFCLGLFLSFRRKAAKGALVVLLGFGALLSAPKAEAQEPCRQPGEKPAQSDPES